MKSEIIAAIIGGACTILVPLITVVLRNRNRKQPLIRQATFADVEKYDPKVEHIRQKAEPEKPMEFNSLPGWLVLGLLLAIGLILAIVRWILKLMNS
jgi:hypothetical protein